ncbi:putative dTMP kinase [Burkholderia pseudomallei ABCPW 107]|nr:putative dTMP kinase [Burkholderia pseudomallei ABCPW 107]
MSASAIRRAPIPRRSSQSCARWACDGRAHGDDHGRHGGDGRCRRARGRARRARRRAGRRARPRLSTSTRRGCPKRAQRGRRHARRRACAARGARARRSRSCPPARPRSRRPPQARLSARAAFARRPRPPSAPAILRAGSNDVNRTTRALPSGVEQRAAPARRVANRRIDGVRRALGARERRASQHVVLARVRRGRAHRVAPYRVMMVSESASRRCDPVLGAPDAALDSGQRLSGRGAYACSACGRSGRGQLRRGSPPARRRICRWGGAAGDARAGRPERR